MRKDCYPYSSLTIVPVHSMAGIQYLPNSVNVTITYLDAEIKKKKRVSPHSFFFPYPPHPLHQEVLLPLSPCRVSPNFSTSLQLY